MEADKVRDIQAKWGALVNLRLEPSGETCKVTLELEGGGSEGPRSFLRMGMWSKRASRAEVIKRLEPLAGSGQSVTLEVGCEAGIATIRLPAPVGGARGEEGANQGGKRRDDHEPAAGGHAVGHDGDETVAGIMDVDERGAQSVTLNLQGLQLNTSPEESGLRGGEVAVSVGTCAGAAAGERAAGEDDDHEDGDDEAAPPGPSLLPPSMATAGERTVAPLLQRVCDLLQIPDKLQHLLGGRVWQVSPKLLAACNWRAGCWARNDVARHAAGKPCRSAALAQQHFWDMTGLACLFWVDDAPPGGALAPAILVLYIPGPLMRQEFAVDAEVVRLRQQAMVDAQTLKKQPRGPLKERGGVTFTAGYRYIATHKEARVPMYAHTSRSPLARLAIGAFGAAVAALLAAVWPYVLKLACEPAVGNPALLSVTAPWGFVPVGLDYFTHPHVDKDDATHTVVFLTVWKAATGRQCEDFADSVERGEHVSRNIFTFGGVSAYKRTADCDLLVFDARRVMHGADLCVAKDAPVDAAGRRCGVTMGAGVVSRQTDVDAGRAVARGCLELAAEGKTAGRDTARELGLAFERDIRDVLSRSRDEVQVALKRQARPGSVS